MSKPMKSRRISGTLVFSAVLIAMMSAAAVGLAATLKLSGSANSGLGRTVVVNPAGRTLYTLSGETSSHLLCKGACLQVWPPVTVPSRSTRIVLSGGARGKVSILRRSNGVLQVTLRGMPIYRFSGDRGKGEANGEGIKADGGTWHAAGAAAVPASSVPSKTTTAPYTY